MRQRLEFRQRAEVAEEPLRLVHRSEAEDRLEEVSCLARSPFV